MAIDWLSLFKKSQDSLKGYIKPAELLRALGLALTTGGSFWGFLEVVGNHLSDFVIDPVALLNLQQIISHANAKNWVAVALGAVTFGISLYNKFNKGAVVLNPSAIPNSKILVVESVVDKTVAEKVADGVPVAPKSL
jgi:hypothetical protein